MYTTDFQHLIVTSLYILVAHWRTFLHCLSTAGSAGGAAVMRKTRQGARRRRLVIAIHTTVAHLAWCTVVSEAHRCEVSERPICGQPHTKVSKTLSVGTVSRIYHHRTLERFGREIQCLFRAIHFCLKIVLLKTRILHNFFNKGFYNY